MYISFGFSHNKLIILICKDFEQYDNNNHDSHDNNNQEPNMANISSIWASNDKISLTPELFKLLFILKGG